MFQKKPLILLALLFLLAAVSGNAGKNVEILSRTDDSLSLLYMTGGLEVTEKTGSHYITADGCADFVETGNNYITAATTSMKKKSEKV